MAVARTHHRRRLPSSDELNVQVKMWGIMPQEFAWFTDTATANYCPKFGGHN